MSKTDAPSLKAVKKAKQTPGKRIDQVKEALFFELHELEMHGHYIDILSGRPVIVTSIDREIETLVSAEFKFFNPVTGKHEEANATNYQLYRMV